MKALVSGELTFFFCSCLCGVAIAVFYDIMRCIFANEFYSVAVCNICDAVFVICSCTIMIFVLFSVSNGYIRFYEFAGAFLGAILYKFTLSPFIFAVFLKILKVFLIVFNFFSKILLTPLVFMYKIIHNTISVFIGGISKINAHFRIKVSTLFSFFKIHTKKP